MIGTLVSLVAGILAAASLIVKFKPNSKELIHKITPFQGIVGLVLVGFAIWNTIQLIRVLAIGYFDVWGIIIIALQYIVGFLLSFGLLGQILFSKSDAAMQKGAAIREKLLAYQGLLGMALIFFSVWILIKTI